MTITTQAARQGTVSNNHAVSKVLIISTAFSFASLALISLLY